jgi:Protein of unknown function (DUF4058)
MEACFMPSPFPGMNPYFEQPTFWSSFHTRLIGAIDSALSSELRPHYYVEIKTRFYQDTEGNETGSEGEGEAGTPQAVLSAEMTSPPVTLGFKKWRVLHSHLTVPSLSFCQFL